MITKELRRYAISKQQNKATFKKGVPNISELTELVPVYRETNEGLVEYIKYKNILYKKVYILSTEKEWGITVG